MTRQIRRSRKLPALLLALSAATVAGVLVGGGAVQAAPPTDASVVDYSQCANDAPGSAGDSKDCTPQGWIFGILNANNSQYAEDQGTAQRLIAELPKNGVLADRKIELKYLVRKGTHHAYDSLASWDLTIAHGANGAAQKLIACQSLNTPTTNACNALWDAGAEDEGIPNDTSSVTPNTGVGAPSAVVSNHMIPAGDDREFRMFGLGDCGDIEVPTYGTLVDESGDLYQTITFQYDLCGSVGGTALDGNGDLKLDDNTKVMLLFSGHLAAGGGARSWGSGNGASFINGGPYHIKLTKLDGGSIGNRDNQITAGAILPLTTAVTTDLHETNDQGVDVNPANNQCSGSPVVCGSGITVGPGAYVTDYATVTPLGATGTVNFKYYPSSADCTNDTNGTVAGTNKALDANGVAKSSTIQFTGETTVYWRAFFVGTDISNNSQSSCTGEVLTVSKANPTLTSAPRLIPQDKVTMSGIVSGGTPTATIQFKLFSPSNATCDPAGTAAVYTESQNVTGNGDYVTTNSGDPAVNSGFRITSASATGTYSWLVTYSGDSKNNSKTSACGVESFTVTGVTDKAS